MTESVFNQAERKRAWRLNFRRNPDPVIQEFLSDKGGSYEPELLEFARHERIGKDRLAYLQNSDITDFLWRVKRNNRPVDRHVKALKTFFRWLAEKGFYPLPPDKVFAAKEI